MSHLSEHQRRRLMYVDGVSPAPAKKFCEFYFGDAFMLFSPNPNDDKYDVYLDLELVTQDQIDYWQQYWSDRWRLLDGKKVVRDAEK